MHEPLYPSLCQINTRVVLTELSRALGRPATLDDIPDAELDRAAGMGFDWIWLLSVWRPGPAGQRVSRANREGRREFEETLPDLREEDIAGSGFAITGYTVHPDLGEDAALARLRERLRARGLRLMLDFVPNHTGCGIGSWPASVRVWEIKSRGRGPRGGPPPPEGVHVDYAPEGLACAGRGRRWDGCAQLRLPYAARKPCNAAVLARRGGY